MNEDQVKQRAVLELLKQQAGTVLATVAVCAAIFVAYSSLKKDPTFEVIKFAPEISWRVANMTNEDRAFFKMTADQIQANLVAWAQMVDKLQHQQAPVAPPVPPVKK